MPTMYKSDMHARCERYVKKALESKDKKRFEDISNRVILLYKKRFGTFQIIRTNNGIISLLSVSLDDDFDVLVCGYETKVIGREILLENVIQTRFKSTKAVEIAITKMLIAIKTT